LQRFERTDATNGSTKAIFRRLKEGLSSSTNVYGTYNSLCCVTIQGMNLPSQGICV
jgi:hypothetical protein